MIGYIEMGGQLRDILDICGQLWESVGYIERWVANSVIYCTYVANYGRVLGTLRDGWPIKGDGWLHMRD